MKSFKITSLNTDVEGSPPPPPAPSDPSVDAANAAVAAAAAAAAAAEGSAHQYGDLYPTYNTYLMNRYSDQRRRSDPVAVDEKLTFDNGDVYSLEAILQHECASVHGGHYIIFLRLNGLWECRDDDRRTLYKGAKLPPYSPENIYVVVYGLSNSSESSTSRGSSAPVSLEF